MILRVGRVGEATPGGALSHPVRWGAAAVGVRGAAGTYL